MEGSPGPIALELDRLLREPQLEDAFVRGALLLTLGVAFPTDVARSLADEYLGERPGELVRAAWLVVGLTCGADEEGGVDLDGFETGDTRTHLTIWPVTIPAPRDDSSLGLALAQLLPAKLYTVRTPDADAAAEAQAEEAILTRETIVLALFAGGARKPGPTRDWLLEWAIDTDMNRACIWSLCLAARDDPDLALVLRDLAAQVGVVMFNEGALIAELLSRLAGRGDLVFDMLGAELGAGETDGNVMAYITKSSAMYALGEIIEAGDSELAELATRLLIETSVDSSRADDVRKLTLVQLSVSNSSRASEAIGPVLIGAGSGDLKQRAATMARFVPEEDRQGMREALMGGYSDNLPGEVKQSYLRSLMYLGGEDSRSFLNSLVGSDDLGEQFNKKLADYLSE